MLKCLVDEDSLAFNLQDRSSKTDNNAILLMKNLLSSLNLKCTFRSYTTQILQELVPDLTSSFLENQEKNFSDLAPTEPPRQIFPLSKGVEVVAL